jgi:catechol 2,3-dioxygenase-like lactoylglutathione lyase family enzyme
MEAMSNAPRGGSIDRDGGRQMSSADDDAWPAAIPFHSRRVRWEATRLLVHDFLAQYTPEHPDTSDHSNQRLSEFMKLGYTILYVPDVAASLAFFEQAFGFRRRFLHESGTYGELDTGETTLSFAAHELGDSNFPGGHVHAHSSTQPLGMEIALVTTDVAKEHSAAIAHGARELAAPSTKPWGQVVSYVRAPDGCLIELCTPVEG